jgi:hypothetical protein
MMPCQMLVPNLRLLQVPQYVTDSSWTFWLHDMTDASARLNTTDNVFSPRDFASPKLARTFPVLTPIMPRPFVSSNAPTSSSASPNAMRFVSFRSSVCAYASFVLRALRGLAGVSDDSGGGRASSGRNGAYRLPPRRFLGPSLGMASAFTTFDGGGAVNRSRCFSIFSLSSSP